MDTIDFTYLHLKYGIHDYNSETVSTLCRRLGPRIVLTWINTEYSKWLKKTPITVDLESAQRRNRVKTAARRLRKGGVWTSKVYSMTYILSIVSTKETKENLYILLERNIGNEEW